MKKIMAVMLSLLACTVLLAGCNTSSESNEEQSLKVYSFSGENEYISVSNGVIILDGKDEICYGGDLKVMSDDFADITTYSTTIYINGSEKETLLSNGVDDQTGILPKNAVKIETPQSIEEMMKKAAPIAAVLCVLMFVTMLRRRGGCR